MKYKVGNKVRIKSIDWYNENKDENGNVLCFENIHKFTSLMSSYCGKVVTISTIITGDDEYFIEEDGETDWWTDDMIEGLVEEPITLNGREVMLKLADVELSSGSTTIWDLPNGYIFKDENGNVINATKIVLEKKSSKTDDVIKWLREQDMSKYISILCSGVCSITFDTEKLIKNITEIIRNK